MLLTLQQTIFLWICTCVIVCRSYAANNNGVCERMPTTTTTVLNNGRHKSKCPLKGFGQSLFKSMIFRQVMCADEFATVGHAMKKKVFPVKTQKYRIFYLKYHSISLL
jgi:hypothetical protein